MELSESSCCFNRSGKYFAVCPVEGELKVWNSKTGSLHHTFVSASLRGKVTCLAWSREKQGKKKRTSEEVIGGGVGSKVILWRLGKEEETVLPSEHSEEVTCVDWDLGSSRLYSGSKDKHVVAWNVDTGESIRKWKVDKTAVQCISCYGDGSVLLTAGRTIKMWSLEDYSVIKKVTGHATAVGGLCFVGGKSFLSCATNERVINYWAPEESVTAVATLTCEEEVKSFQSYVEAGGAVRVAVVGQDGGLFLYHFSVSGPQSMPLTATYTVQYVSSPAKPGTPAPLPVLAAILPAVSPDVLTVAHSSFIKPVLESMEFTQSSEKTCLVRDVQASGLLLPGSRKAAAALSTAPVTVLGPGNMTLPTKPANRQEEDVRPLSERLASDRRKTKGGALPTADSLTELLVQSIASGDGKLLEEVLRVTKERLIFATVKRLPLHIVLPFLKKLVEILQSSPYRGLQLSLWIKTILASHPAYLLNVPELSASLSCLQQLLESRVSTFSRLCHLQGKLELMLIQVDGEEKGASREEQAMPLATTIEEDSEKEWSSQEEEEQLSDNSSEMLAGQELENEGCQEGLSN